MLISIFLHNNYCRSDIEITSVNTDGGMVALLPVNETFPIGNRCRLAIAIPSDFRRIQSTQESFCEYIPLSDDDPANWSHIITLQSLRGESLSAGQWLTSVKQSMCELATDVTILSDSVYAYSTCIAAVLGIAYTYKNRREIMYAYYCSGPYDCSGVQIAIALVNGVTEREAIQKINDFAQHNITVRLY